MCPHSQLKEEGSPQTIRPRRFRPLQTAAPFHRSCSWTEQCSVKAVSCTAPHLGPRQPFTSSCAGRSERNLICEVGTRVRVWAEGHARVKSCLLLLEKSPFTDGESSVHERQGVPNFWKDGETLSCLRPGAASRGAASNRLVTHKGQNSSSVLQAKVRKAQNCLS